MASRGARSTVLLALLVFLLVPGCGGGSRPGRIIVLGLDGFYPQAVDLLLSEGKLPNFAKLRQDGAYGRLRSGKPLLSPVVWTTVATGKTPDQHGIGHFVVLDTEGKFMSWEMLPDRKLLRMLEESLAAFWLFQHLCVGWSSNYLRNV